MEDAVEDFPDVAVDIRYSGGLQRRTCKAHHRIPRPTGRRVRTLAGTLDGSPYEFVQAFGLAKDGVPSKRTSTYFLLDGQPYYFESETLMPEPVEVWTL